MLLARASSGQSWTTASYQVAGAFWVLQSLKAPLLVWLRVAFNAGSDDAGRFRTRSIHPNTAPPASQASPNMKTFDFPEASLGLCLCQKVSLHLERGERLMLLQLLSVASGFKPVPLKHLELGWCRQTSPGPSAVPSSSAL